MKLGNQVEWALHCCAVLAAQPPNTYVPSKALADFHGVPKEYLAKALQALAKAKLVRATLGPSGGYALNRPAAQITFLDIVEAVEGKKSTFTCTEIRRQNPCLSERTVIVGVCAIAKVMYRADTAWREELRRVTLADLGAQLQRDLPPALLEKSAHWFASFKQV